MFQGTGSGLRLLFATMAGVCLIFFTAATTASASTYTDLQSAGPGDEVALSDTATLVVGSATTEGGTTTISDALVDLGGGVQGSGVTGTLSGTTLTLEGGEFTIPTTVSDQVHSIDAADPFVYSFDGGEVAEPPTGALVSTGETASATAAKSVTAFRAVTQEDAPLAVPAPLGNDSYRIRVTLAGPNWSVKVYVRRGGVELPDGPAFEGTVNITTAAYSFKVKYPALIDGKTVVIAGNISGSNVFQPASITGLGGSITGEIELTKGVFFTGGSVSWDASGLKLSGGARVDCRAGSVSGNIAGAFKDDRNWSLELTGGTNNGCVVTDDLNLPSGDLTGQIEKADGAVTGLFEIGGKIQTTLLPAGVNEWDARFRFIYDGTPAGSHIAFFASAGIGTAQGKINFDGTFGLNADFEIPFGGSKVAFDGDINRTTPSGAVTYDVGGSANIAINDKTTLGGSLRLTNSTLSLAGHVQFACPVSGTIKGGVSGTIPLTSSNDWALAISGGTGSAGCQVTKEFGLGAGSGLAGEVKSVGGVVSVNADANATINTTLIPTKTSFSMKFSFAASKGAYKVAVAGSTQGASFTANVASNGTFGLSFALSDLALGGVTLGAKGTINRTTPGGAVTYSISGSLAGQAKIYDNLYLRSGSLSITSTGGLRFSGAVRQICTSGYLDASATGTIADSKNFSFNAVGQSSQCRLGRNALFNGQTFFADIDSTNGKVLYNAGIAAARIELFRATVHLIGDVKTWLTGVQGSISNTCAGCYDRGVTQLAFQTRVNAEYRVVSKVTRTVKKVSKVCDWIPFVGNLCKDIVKWVTETVDVWTTVNGAATGYGTVEVRGTSVRKITIGVKDPQFGILGTSHWPSLTARMQRDLEVAFTT